jgi:hypothetical protein
MLSYGYVVFTCGWKACLMYNKPVPTAPITQYVTAEDPEVLTVLRNAREYIENKDYASAMGSINYQLEQPGYEFNMALITFTIENLSSAQINSSVDSDSSSVDPDRHYKSYRAEESSYFAKLYDWYYTNPSLR